MIAESDILARLLAELSKDVYFGLGQADDDVSGCYREVCRLPVDTLMSQHLLTTTEDVPALRAAGTMRARRVQRLPVLNGDRLVGLVFQTDIHAALLGASVRLDAALLPT
jgi:CBS domain-containing protein